MTIESRPNLFDFATSELSQDAMICWLLQCADSTNKDQKLQKLGKVFWETLLNHKRENKQPIKFDSEIRVKVRKQVNNIDVLAKINDLHVLLIEDKTGTGPKGNNQLKLYYETVHSGVSEIGKLGDMSLHPIFLKTGNFSREEEIFVESPEFGGYKVFNRKIFLDVLNKYDGENAIAVDFRRYLQAIEDRTNQWKYSHSIDWRKDWWKHTGLLSELERKLISDENITGVRWGQVNNPAGGFLGLWWGSKRVKENTTDDVYLQLEDHRLCFKVGAGESDDKQALKLKWHNRLTREHPKVVKPPRLRVGSSMTVARWDGRWMQFNEHGFDLTATLSILQEAENVLFAASQVGD